MAVDGVDRTVGDHGLLAYRVPDELGHDVAVGRVVWAPIRRSYARGVVVSTDAGQPSGPYDVRPLLGTVLPPVTIDRRRIEVALWLARETITAPFSALEPFLPPGYGKDAVVAYRLAKADVNGDALTPTQRAVVTALADGRPVPLPELQRRTGRKLTSVLGDLLQSGVVAAEPSQSTDTGTEPTDRYVRLAVEPEGVDASSAGLRSESQRALLEEIAGRSADLAGDADRFLPAAPILRDGGWTLPHLRRLADLGLVEVAERPRLPASWLTDERPDPTPPLTPDQAAVWTEVEAALVAREHQTFLLRGVTGSGKTEIYLRAVDWCLLNGRGAIVLVPEITLATQVVRRFRRRFPGRVAVLHSSLPAGERLASWRALADGRIRVVVGARSALFAPMPDVGLIVLDEEHEGAYKQDTDPRYHARALAERLAQVTGATVVLGSATPAIETTHRAETGEARLLSLNFRVRPPGGDPSLTGPLELPAVEIADMRLELHRGNTGILSESLRETVEATMGRGEQALLLLNRRGMATVVLCQDGGHQLQCPHCDIPLVYHQDKTLLICHRCDYRERPPRACPVCGGRLTYFGAGTQRVESEVAAIFPGARLLRWDQDTARLRGAPETMLRAVEEGNVDIVVGTQMIAKGLDLPKVTTVGVINADSMLHLPDFRSAERTFQLLTQVAGRAGRRGAGRVIIQTYTPHHYAVRAAAEHDYDRFYQEEIIFRDQNFYPPFTRLIRFAYRHRDEAKVAAEAQTYAHILVQHVRLNGQVGVADILGPTPAFAARIRDEYQWQIVLRSPDLEALLPRLPHRPGWTVDVDPLSML
ncbi:MAG TPA: primosomal protein N' [Thermomicrobiales bacterium]|nr:primosomal protein N' [Thermomicrobiales bacterium]